MVLFLFHFRRFHLTSHVHFCATTESDIVMFYHFHIYVKTSVKYISYRLNFKLPHFSSFSYQDFRCHCFTYFITHVMLYTFCLQPFFVYLFFSQFYSCFSYFSLQVMFKQILTKSLLKISPFERQYSIIYRTNRKHTMLQYLSQYRLVYTAQLKTQSIRLCRINESQFDL